MRQPAHIHAGEALSARCLACGADGELDVPALRQRWPGMISTELREWLTCGHRGAAVTRYRPAPAPPW